MFERKRFYQFGVQKPGYNTVRRIFQLRPFEKIPGLKYRYFWDYGHGRDNDYFLSIRVEQGNNAKSFPLKANELFGSNLLWFSRIKEQTEIEHLEYEI